MVQPVPVFAGGGQADDGEGLPDEGGAGGVAGGGAGGGGQLQGAAGGVAGSEPGGPGHRHLHHHQHGVCIYIYRYLHRPEVTSIIILGQHLTICSLVFIVSVTKTAGCQPRLVVGSSSWS